MKQKDRYLQPVFFNIIFLSGKNMDEKGLRLEIIREDSKYLEETLRLYEDAFPDNERRPLKPLQDDPKKEGIIYAVLDDEEYIGFIVLLSYGKITHILYFVTEEAFRNRGFGRKILELVKEAFPDQKILADVEGPDEMSGNNDQRLRRISFYQRSGYRQTDIEYEWRDERYVIMVSGDYISLEEFRDFWYHFYNEREDFNY